MNQISIKSFWEKHGVTIASYFFVILFVLIAPVCFGQADELTNASEEIKDTVVVIVRNLILIALILGTVYVVYALATGQQNARQLVVGFVIGWIFYLVVFELLITGN